MQATVASEPTRNQPLRPAQRWRVASVPQPTATSMKPSASRTASSTPEMTVSAMPKRSAYSAGRIENAGPRSRNIGSVGSANRTSRPVDSRGVGRAIRHPPR